MVYYIATFEDNVYLNYSYMFIASFIVYLFMPLQHTVSGYLKYSFIYIHALSTSFIKPLGYSSHKERLWKLVGNWTIVVIKILQRTHSY